MSSYKGLESAGIVVGIALLLTFIVVLPAGYGVAEARANDTIFGNTGNGPATKRHKKHRKSKRKSYKQR